MPVENSPLRCAIRLQGKMRATVLEAVKGRAPRRALGGTDEHSGFDRFGGLWITYLSVTTSSDTESGGPLYTVYSADKGETFNLIETVRALDPSQVPDTIKVHYGGLDFDYLGIGPDATNLNYDTVWTSIGDALDTCAPNEYQLIVYGLRVKGLGVANIDLPSFKEYIVPPAVSGTPG
jgi:hypothetical protein